MRVPFCRCSVLHKAIKELKNFRAFNVVIAMDRCNQPFLGVPLPAWGSRQLPTLL